MYWNRGGGGGECNVCSFQRYLQIAGAWHWKEFKVFLITKHSIPNNDIDRWEQNN